MERAETLKRAGGWLGGRPLVHQADQLRAEGGDEPHARLPADAHRAVPVGDTPHAAHCHPLAPRAERVQRARQNRRQPAAVARGAGVRSLSVI